MRLGCRCLLKNIYSLFTHLSCVHFCGTICPDMHDTQIFLSRFERGAGGDEGTPSLGLHYLAVSGAKK
eukprot:9245655-Ditylum_brightwellii.AAC.1